MSRLNQERQKALEPNRIEYAIKAIDKLGYEIIWQDDTKIKFLFKGETITHFAYSGWHAGKSINDGRGIEKLIKQIE